MVSPRCRDKVLLGLLLSQPQVEPNHRGPCLEVPEKLAKSKDLWGTHLKRNKIR